MPNSALFEISKPSSLRDSWNYIVRTSTSHSRNTKGIDGLSINDIGSKRDRFLLSLSKQIRDTSGYQYDDLRSVLLPKPNGKFRVICVPTVQDRIVQRTVLDFLSVNDKCKLINKVSYGFVRDRTVQDAAKRACKLRKKKPWVYKTDITDFFNSVPRKELFEELDKVIKHTTLLNLLKSAVNCEIFEPNNYRAKKIKKMVFMKEKVSVKECHCRLSLQISS